VSKWPPQQRQCQEAPRQQSDCASQKALPPTKVRARRWARRILLAFRILIIDVVTIGGFAFLLYDLGYQTYISADVVYSDAATALENPIALKNNSNIFTVTNIKWTCYTDNLVYESGLSFDRNNLINTGGPIELEKKDVANVTCAKRILDINSKLKSGRIILVLTYDAHLVGPINWHRGPVTVPFTWKGDIANPQWVKGSFI
jgi:hypothetical protein